jgi:hypothetical protein
MQMSYASGQRMFGDLKKNGFDLESSHMEDYLCLSRLALAVISLYVRLMTTEANLANTPASHYGLLLGS